MTEDGRMAGLWEWRERLWGEVHSIDGPRKDRLVLLGKQLDQAMFCTCDVVHDRPDPACRIHPSGSSRSPEARSEAAGLASPPRSDHRTAQAEAARDQTIFERQKLELELKEAAGAVAELSEAMQHVEVCGSEERVEQVEIAIDALRRRLSGGPGIPSDTPVSSEDLGAAKRASAESAVPRAGDPDAAAKAVSFLLPTGWQLMRQEWIDEMLNEQTALRIERDNARDALTRGERE